MKIFVHLFISFALALSLVSAFADGPKGKAGKNPPAEAPRIPDERPERDKDRDRDRDADYGRDNSGAGKSQPERGNERSREMLEQRDARKEAKSEYREDRMPGQEGKGNDTGQQEKKEDDKPWYDIL